MNSEYISAPGVIPTMDSVIGTTISQNSSTQRPLTPIEVENFASTVEMFNMIRARPISDLSSNISALDLESKEPTLGLSLDLQENIDAKGKEFQILNEPPVTVQNVDPHVKEFQILDGIAVQSYHIDIEDASGPDGQMMIRIWALDNAHYPNGQEFDSEGKPQEKISEPYLLKIDDFPAYCFIELPEFVKGKWTSWTPTTASLVIDALYEKLQEKRHECYEYKLSNFGYMPHLYYARGDKKYPMIRVDFPTMKAMYAANEILSEPLEVSGKGLLRCKVWENNLVDSIIKLLTRQNITHTSWITCRARKEHPKCKISSLENEYVIDWTSLTEIPEAITKEWCTLPGRVALDIETYSHRHKMFPDKWNPKHVAFMLSAIYQRVNSQERIRYGIIMGDCNHIPEERLKNVTIFKVKTEEELIRMTAAIIQHHDPEILTGYNVLGFDYPYLDTRLKLLNRKWPVIGRILNRKATVKSSSWSSSGYGVNQNNKLIAEGRITIDMLLAVKRGGHKLNFFDLNTVADFLIGKRKHDVSAQYMFRTYEAMKNTKPGTPEHLKALEDMTQVMEYCIRDSELCLDIMDETHLWEEALVMSSVMNVTIDDYYTRGQQIRCVAQLYRLAVKEGYVLNYVPCPEIPFEGGQVRDCIKGLHENVICIDFNSLYPSVIRANNICFTTLLPADIVSQMTREELERIANVIDINCNEEYDPDEDDLDEEEMKERYRARGTKGMYTLAFLKKEIKEGLLPRLVGYLVNERNRVKGILKNEKDPLQRILLDKRQLALKTSANSFYGFLGIRQGARLPFLQGAMATTAWGRQYITRVNKYIGEKYPGSRIIYGDTDSTFFTLPQIKEPSQCQEWGDIVAKDVSALFPPPLNMDVEKCIRMLSIGKKMYLGAYITNEGKSYITETSNFKLDKDGELDLLVRGVLIARRDNCLWARKVYRKTALMIMNRSPITETLKYVFSEVKRIIAGDVPMEELAIVRTLGANYKSESYFMKVFGEELAKLGRPQLPGDRLAYVVVEKPGEKLLGKRMLTPELAIEFEAKIDYRYYLEKLLANHLDKLIGAGYTDIIPYIDITYMPKSNSKLATLNAVIDLYLRMEKKGTTLDQLHAEIEKRYTQYTKWKDSGDTYLPYQRATGIDKVVIYDDELSSELKKQQSMQQQQPQQNQSWYNSPSVQSGNIQQQYTQPQSCYSSTQMYGNTQQQSWNSTQKYTNIQQQSQWSGYSPPVVQQQSYTNTSQSWYGNSQTSYAGQGYNIYNGPSYDMYSNSNRIILED